MVHPTRNCTILMVDDEPANLDLLEAFLLADGYSTMVGTSDAREAVALFETHEPDLVLLDLHMPYLDGFAVLREIRRRTAEGDYLPVLVLTADITSEAKERALSGGARDFLTKPFDAAEVLLRVQNLLEARLLHRHQREARERAEELAAENARLFAEALQATRARDRMLSVVAHDLRNPLAVVAMNAEMMLELMPPGTKDYERETLGVIFQASGRMQRLVEDLLDVTRIEHGTFTLQLGDCRTAELFEEAEQLLQPAAEANGVALAFSGADRMPKVRVDGARVIQVISNLVGNAIKFTPEGGRVDVRCEHADGWVEVVVSDTGPGIAAEQLPHLFDAFWQAREDDRRGVGLGLWIVRSIVEAHGGSIVAESEPGQGASFRFTLPCVLPPAAESPGAGRAMVAVPGLVAEAEARP